MRGGLLVCLVGLAAAPAFAGAHDELDAAIALYDAKKSEQAVKALRSVVGLPDATPAIRARAHLYMGLALAKLGEKVAADASFADAFTLDAMLAIPFGTRTDIAARAEQARAETKARSEAKRDMAEWSTPNGPAGPPAPAPQPEPGPPPPPLAQAEPVGPPPRPSPQPGPGPDPILVAPPLPAGEPLPPLPPPTATPAPLPRPPPGPVPVPVVRAEKKKNPDDGVHFGVGMRFIWNPVDDVVGPAAELNFGSQSGGRRLAALFTVFPGRQWGVGGALRILFGPVIKRWRIEFGFDLGAIIFPSHLQTAIEVTTRVLGFSFPAGPVRVNVQLLTAGLYMNFVSNPIAVIPTLTAGFGVEY